MQQGNNSQNNQGNQNSQNQNNQSLFEAGEQFFTATANNNQQASSGSITAKDVSMLEDQMNHEAMAYKKCSLYSQYFNDQTLKNMASSAAQHHKQHFDSLQSYLNCHQ